MNKASREYTKRPTVASDDDDDKKKSRIKSVGVVKKKTIKSSILHHSSSDSEEEEDTRKRTKSATAAPSSTISQVRQKAITASNNSKSTSAKIQNKLSISSLEEEEAIRKWLKKTSTPSPSSEGKKNVKKASTSPPPVVMSSPSPPLPSPSLVKSPGNSSKKVPEMNVEILSNQKIFLETEEKKLISTSSSKKIVEKEIEINNKEINHNNISPTLKSNNNNNNNNVINNKDKTIEKEREKDKEKGKDNEKKAEKEDKEKKIEIDNKIKHLSIYEEPVENLLKIPAYISHAIRLSIQQELLQPKFTDLNIDEFNRVVEHKPHFRGNLGFDSYIFHDYAPAVFMEMRRLYGITSDNYINSMCGEAMCEAVIGEGKSGMMFFYTHNKNYIIKTLKKAEIPLLTKLLPFIKGHLESSKEGSIISSLLPKYCGMHSVKFPNGTSMCLVVMENVFAHQVNPHIEKYDLKGSLRGRYVENDELIENEASTLKDLNFRLKIKISPEKKLSLIETIKRDVELLEKFNLMDYSLLVGIEQDSKHTNILKHNRQKSSMEDVFKEEGLASEAADKIVDNLNDELLSAIIMREYDARAHAVKSLPQGININVEVAEFGVVNKSYAVFCLHILSKANAEDKAKKWIVWRRFSDFTNLLNVLNGDLKETGYTFPPLPSKGNSFTKKLDVEFLRNRRDEINVWMNRVIKLFGGKVPCSDALRLFLTLNINESPRNLEILESVKEEENNMHADASTHRSPISLFEAIIEREDGSVSKCIIHMGIIDILTEYGVGKKLETYLLTSLAPKKTISAISAREYADRLCSFISQMFV